MPDAGGRGVWGSDSLLSHCKALMGFTEESRSLIAASHGLCRALFFFPQSTWVTTFSSTPQYAAAQIGESSPDS